MFSFIFQQDHLIEFLPCFLKNHLLDSVSRNINMNYFYIWGPSENDSEVPYSEYNSQIIMFHICEESST